MGVSIGVVKEVSFDQLRQVLYGVINRVVSGMT